MNDEDVNPMTGTNMRIAEILSVKYGSAEVEGLYLSLSDPGFVKDIDVLRTKYKIAIYDKNVSDVSAQQYIADCVAKTHGKTTTKQEDFKRYYSEFDEQMRDLYIKHKVPEPPIDLMDQYVVKGDALLQQNQAHNLIQVNMNKKSKSLVIRLDRSVTKRDFLEVMNDIYASWDLLRGENSKKQPSDMVSLHSRIVREAKMNTRQDAAEKFKQSPENVDQIVKRFNKAKKNRDIGPDKK